MSFNRNIYRELDKWSASPHRKPLVLRGARQVGKTTAVKAFGASFDTFIALNLEIAADRALFENDLPLDELVQRIFLEKNLQRGRHTLLFIDEIQNSPRAVEQMRYFYEQMPELFVIGAGSLLEIMMDAHKISFPVGRVEYRYLFPLTFEEFLEATGQTEALTVYRQIPVPPWAYDRLFALFHRYVLVGGMPEIVARYKESNDIAALKPVYQGLLTAYVDDVSKYAKNAAEVQVIRHVIESAPYETGRRITFERFGNSPYRSREAGNALRTLERAMLLYLRYPTTAQKPPLTPDLKKKPRLQFVDTGLLNYAAGLQAQFFAHADLHSFHKGILAEHVVAQEIMALDTLAIRKPLFWVREVRQSNAEIDAIMSFRERAVPVEVKAGKSGTLRSLHAFVDGAPHDLAVRMHAGPLGLSKQTTPKGTPYRLLDLPYFLAGKLPEYLEWAVSGNGTL
ncbi:MAG TPA: AAA family ATPase [bacterium]|nr:AAA family ATPase [bacterium]